jgi:hypothetical protein
MRFANRTGSLAPEKFAFTKSIASSNRRTVSHWLPSALLILLAAAGMSLAQAQSSCSASISQGAGGIWFSSAVAAAQSEFPATPYCPGPYCLDDFSVDASNCQQASNWVCFASYNRFDAPGSSFCEQASPGACGPQPANYFEIGLDGSGPCQSYWVAPTTNASSSCNCVGDPINPALGNVYKREEDDVRVGGASPIEFQRFYNSAGATASDLGVGWSHSYSRSISPHVYASTVAPYFGQSSMVSAQYADPATACVSGFADVQGAVSVWTGASAAYSGNVCVISNSSGTILGTLEVYSTYLDSAPPTPVEYDVVRDDGLTIRYTSQG